MKLFENMEKSEVGFKDVKRRKRSIEKGGSGDAASDRNIKDSDQELVADVPLSPPFADTKLPEASAAETAEVKSDDMDSSVVDAVDTKAVVNSCTAASSIQGSDQSSIVDSVTSDLPAVDAEEKSRGIDESSVSQSQSPCSPIKQSCPIRTKSPEKLLTCTKSPEKPPTPTKSPEKPLHVKVDADKTDLVDISTTITDSLTTVTHDAMEGTVKLSEWEPSIELPKLDADNTSAEGKTNAVRDVPKSVTATPIQTDIRTKTIDVTKKTDIASEAKSRAVKGGQKPLPTAKLKFGMYSRKPLASRMAVIRDEQESSSSSESDDDDDEDVADESPSESKTAEEPKQPSVNSLLFYLLIGFALYLLFFHCGRMLKV